MFKGRISSSLLQLEIRSPEKNCFYVYWVCVVRILRLNMRIVFVRERTIPEKSTGIKPLTILRKNNNRSNYPKRTSDVGTMTIQHFSKVMDIWTTMGRLCTNVACSQGYI